MQLPSLFEYATRTERRADTRHYSVTHVSYSVTHVSYKGHVMVVEICLDGPAYLPRFFHTYLLDSNAVDPASHATLNAAMHRITAVLLELTQQNTFDNADNSTL